jgi:hypothetical protein
MRVDVRSKADHGDLVIATALALWPGVGRPSGRIEVGKLEKTTGDPDRCISGKLW